MKKGLKITIRVILIVLAAVILIAAGYVAYAFIAYHRIGNMKIEPQGSASGNTVESGMSYEIVSYNIGYGAYESDYDFFMDGGTQSWAWSEVIDTGFAYSDHNPVRMSFELE